MFKIFRKEEEPEINIRKFRQYLKRWASESIDKLPDKEIRKAKKSIEDQAMYKLTIIVGRSLEDIFDPYSF